MNDRIRLVVLVRGGSLTMQRRILRVQLIFVCFLATAPPNPPGRPSVQMDVPVNLSRRSGAVLWAGPAGRAPTRIRPPQGPHLQCRSCRCRSMRRRLGTDRQYHWGSRPAGTTGVDGAGPGARSTYPISHAAPTRGILRRRTHMDAMMGD
jgi:hypothetical protein